MNVLLLIHSEPANYPPLLNACTVLNRMGYSITILGMNIVQQSFETGFAFEARIITIKGGCTKYARYWSYLKFVASGVFNLFRIHPTVVYLHDPRGTAIAPLAALLRIPFVYHEHDTVDNLRGMQQWCRDYVLRNSREIVVPNRNRLSKKDRSLGGGRIVEVWNCPLREEVGEGGSAKAQALKLYYHGSIGPERLPIEILDSLVLLPSTVMFNFAGYETEGTFGYIKEYLNHAKTLGLESRVKYLGQTSRKNLLGWTRSHDIGWAAVPAESADINMRNMWGASNKVFDYMSQGLAVIISEQGQWGRMFKDYGLACDPSQGKSIAASLAWFLENRNELKIMGERGRRKILDEWNYDQQFGRVKTFTEYSEAA